MKERSAEFRCPNCSSESTTRVALEHQRGQRTWTGVSAGSEGLAGYSGESQTIASKILAPPNERDTSLLAKEGGCALISLAVLSACSGIVMLYKELSSNAENPDLGILMFGFLLLLGGAWILQFNHSKGAPGREWNERELPKLRREWEARMVCLRCGHTWLPKAG